MTRVFYGNGYNQNKIQGRRNNNDSRPTERPRQWGRNPRHFPSSRPPKGPRRDGFRPVSKSDIPKRERIPPEYFEVTKHHFILLKCLHHHDALLQDFPPSLVKKSEILGNSVYPAFRNDAFRTRMEEITENWRSSVNSALLDHYYELISNAYEFISLHGMPSDLLDMSIRMVTRWARKQLGRKLSDVTLDKAISEIKSQQLVVERTPIAKPEVPKNGVFSRDDSVQHRTQVSDGCTQTEFSDIQTTLASDGFTQTVLEPSITDPFHVRAALASHNVDLDADTSAAEVSPSALAPRDPSALAPRDPSALAPREPSALAPPDLVNLAEEPSFPPPQPSSSAPPGGSLVQATLVDLASISTKTSSGPLDLTKSKVILGDTNFRDLKIEDSTVFSSEKGRLSFFKQHLQSIHGIFEEVSDFVLCLSSLDEKNKTSTNLQALRSLLYNARRLFPNAKVSLLLQCISKSSSESVKGLITEFHSSIRTKLSDVCDIFSLPESFTVSDNSWSPSEKETVYRYVQDFLLVL